MALCEEAVAKIKGKRGFRFIKELGGAVRRETVSKTARFLDERRLLRGRVLDYGCGFGFDADHFGWDSYDPYYRSSEPEGPYDTVVCNLVLNVLSQRHRARALAAIRDLLSVDGRAYLAVPRNVPVEGKLGIHHSLQNYVRLTLPSVFADDRLEIYEFGKHSQFEDLTRDHLSRRDRRHGR